MNKESLKRGFVGAGALAVMMISSQAVAQQTSRYDNTTAFDAENFQIMPAPEMNMLNLATSDVMGRAEVALGGLVHFQDDPLVVTEPGGSEVRERLLASQLKADVWVAFGLGHGVDLGVVMPFVLAQDTSELGLFGEPGEEADGATLSDIRVVPSYQVVNPEDAAGVGMAVAATFYLPMGDTGSFNSDGDLRFEPRVAVDYRHEVGLKVAANAAYQFRPERAVQNFVSNDLLRWGLGAEYALGVADLSATATVFGNIKFAEDRSLENFVEAAEDNRGDAAEALLGVKWAASEQWTVSAGGGTGLTSGVGSPDMRLYTSVGFAPVREDAEVDEAPEPTEAAEEEPSEEVSEEPAAEPAEEVSEEPAAEPAEEVSEEPAAEPAEEVSEEPAEEVSEEPAAEPAEEVSEEPAAEPAEEVSEEPAAEPEGEASDEPAAEPEGEASDEPAEEAAE